MGSPTILAYYTIQLSPHATTRHPQGKHKVQQRRGMMDSVATRRKRMLSLGTLLLLVVVFYAYFAYCMESSIRLPALSLIPDESRGTTEPMKQGSICKLVELNPWDKSINEFLQPVSGPKRQCNFSADHYTELRNGRIRVIKKLYK
ncbi:hypothetical protein Tcan_01724 [Toxocara canis]|uniref:Uncharacterized protein n=1 Tax=Toxocara canis TaxID=6265 RepID=A0A0B2V9D4_TOXCA|nr:hypothetical protein Tcan_01724 [Toxocara canis]